MSSQPEFGQEMYDAEMSRIERLKEQPLYDVVYHVEPTGESELTEERKCVCKAMGLLCEDFSGDYDQFIVTTTSVDDGDYSDQRGEVDVYGEGVYSVMLTVHAEVKRSAFKRAEEVYLVKSGEKTHEWCNQ